MKVSVSTPRYREQKVRSKKGHSKRKYPKVNKKENKVKKKGNKSNRK